MINPIFEQVKSIISPVYLVGGSVRDLILNTKPKDYDFTTSLLPNDIEAKIKLSGKRAFITGKRFGTIGTKINGQLVEITTFRTEQYKEGNRTYEQLIKEAEELDNKLKELYETSPLPKHPPVNKIDKLIIDITEEFLKIKEPND